MTTHEGAARRAAGALLVCGVLTLFGCSSEDGGDASGNSDESSDTGDPADTASSEDGGSDATPLCEELLTQAEIEGLFGEPAVLEETDALSNNGELGQTTCTWSTVEDEENLDDLTSQLVVLQYYDGSTMSGQSFYQPEVQYPDSEPLDLADEAFIDTDGGIAIGFLEGEAAGFLNWTLIDMSGGSQDQLAQKDTVIDLARSFHDRVS